MIFKKYAEIRTLNVEELNKLLRESGGVICKDSKLDHAVEIKFLDTLNEQRDFKDKLKLEMIRKVLEG